MYDIRPLTPQLKQIRDHGLRRRPPARAAAGHDDGLTTHKSDRESIPLAGDWGQDVIRTDPFEPDVRFKSPRTRLGRRSY
jgi:hypothetical protein